MATDLTGLKVKDTYNSLLKIGDNSSLSATPDKISDGLGNESILYLSTSQVSIGTLPATGYDLTVNSAIKTGSIDIVGAATAATLRLTGGSGSQGTLSWNTDEETVDIIQNGATLQVGQEVQVHVKNQTGSTITDGTPVYVTGTLGSSGRLTVAPMIADGTIEAKYFLGITTEDIPNGEDGKVTTFGKIRGLDTSAYSEGQTLYVSASTAGAFQTTAPVAPNLDLEVAIVINSHANQGTIFVRAQNGYYLGLLHDVYLNSPTNNQFLVYNSTTSRWENQGIASVGSINLDTVTDNGNTTTNDINVGDISAGNMTLSGYLRGAANFVIDPAAYGDETGVVQILGDLRVDGTTTTINSTTVTIDDKNIVLASGSATAADANGAGITIDGASATMTYNSTNDRFVFNKNIETNLVGNVTGNVTGSASLNVLKSGDTMTGNLIISKNDPKISFSDQGLIMNLRYDGGVFYIDPVSGSDRDVRITNSGSGGIELIVDGNATATTFIGALQGNADTASALETARNIAVDGAVTGNADFDGSANITITTAVNHNHDDRYYTETEADTRFVNVDGDTMTGNLDFNDDVQARFGTGDDFKIYHNATNTLIDNETGAIIIRNFADDQDIVLASDDGAGSITDYLRVDGSEGSVILYHYGSAKLETTSTGISITGALSGNISTSSISGGTIDINGTTAINLQYNGSTQLRVDSSGVAYLGTVTFANDGISLTDEDSTTDSFFHANVDYDAGLYTVTSNARYGSDYIQVDGKDSRSGNDRVFVISPKDIGDPDPDAMLYLGGDHSITAPNTLVDWHTIEMNALSVQINNAEVATQSWVTSNTTLQDVTDNGNTTTNDIIFDGAAIQFDTSSAPTTANAKIFFGTTPSNPSGSLNYTPLNDYGVDSYGIILQSGYGTGDIGGIKIADDGVMVFGAGDENVFTVVNEDSNTVDFSISNLGKGTFNNGLEINGTTITDAVTANGSITIGHSVPLYFTNTGSGTYNLGVMYSNTTDGFTFEAPWETDATTTRVPFILTWRGGMGFGGLKLNGDTQLHTNDSGLGVDITSPSAKLHVGGTSIFDGLMTVNDGNNYARLGDLNANSTMVLELKDGLNPVQVEAYGNDMRLITAGSHRMSIGGTGNIYVESTNRLYFNGTNAGIWGDGQDLKLFANDDIYIDAPYIRAFNASTEYWRFDQASGATGYSWINVGYLGIGKATPDDKLDVNGVIRSSSSSAGDYVRLYGGSGTAQWDIYGNGENLRFSENSGGGGCVTIDDKLGIGTSDFGGTAAKFLVGSYLSDGSSAIAQLNGFVRIKQELIIHDASDISKEAHLVYDGTNGLYFTPTNGSGNFGIGTTTPDTHLDVSSGVHTKLRVQTTGVADASVEILGYDAGVHIGDPTNGNRWAIWNDGVSTTSKLGFGSYALGTWYTDAAQVMTLTHDGKVGIGAPSPSQKLSVVGNARIENGYVQIVNSSNPSLYINNAVIQWQNYIPSGTNNLSFKDGINDVLVLGYNGANSYFNNTNVGIGTTSPDTKLHIEESSAPTIRFNATTAAGGAGSVQFYNQGTQKFNLTTIASSNDFALYNNGGTNSFNFYVKHSNGNVGIGGTTTPNHPLEVIGFISTNHSSNASGLLIRKASSTIGFVGQSGGWEGNTSSDLAVAAETGGNVRFYSGGSATERFRVKSTGEVQAPYVMLGRIGGPDNTIEFVSSMGSTAYIGGHINYHGGGNLSLCNGGGVVGIGTTATTGSARLVVGNYLSAGSSAIAQLDGFVRLKHGVLIHNDSATGTASYIAYENDGLKLKTEGAGSDKVTIGSSSPGAYNQLLNLHRASGTTGIQMTTGSAYSYITNDGTYLNFASDAGSTGVKFRIHRNAPDDSAYIDSSGMGYHYFLRLGVPSITGGQNTSQSIYIPYGTEYFTMGYKASARSGEAMHRTPVSGAAFYIEAGSTEAGGICLDQDSVNVYGSSDAGTTFRVIDKDADVTTFEMLQTSWNGVFRGDVIAYGSLSSISDRRIKENIEPYENVLDKLCSLGVYSYNKITLPKHKRDRKEIGVIAQEVEAVFPELVNEEKVDKPQDANGLEQIKTVDYEHLTAILLQSIKELRNEVEELKARLNA